MNISHQIEPTSTEHLLTCLGLAIDEAKLVKTIVESKEEVDKLKAEKSVSKRLVHLNREIEYLEAKLIQVRSSARHIQ